MRKFWSYISNSEYSVGTTGQTVYLYDKDGNELNKFKDIKYGYTPMFSPDGKIFVVKSTAGWSAVYSLETKSLVKKFRFSKYDAAQDDGFCFSPDGKLFVNIERHHGGDNLQWALSVYNTEDFSLCSRLMLPDHMALSYIEYDYETDEYYCMGCISGVPDSDFVAKYKNNAIVDVCNYVEKNWFFNIAYMNLKESGFTQKEYETWRLNLDYELDELINMDLTIAKLYKKYSCSR